MKNAAVRKENICTTLDFISVLITAIGYYGDQNDGEENEQQSRNTSEVVRNSFSILTNRI